MSKDDLITQAKNREKEQMVAGIVVIICGIFGFVVLIWSLVRYAWK